MSHEPIVLVLSRAATVLVLAIEREQRHWKMTSSVIVDLTFSAWGSLTRRSILGHQGVYRSARGKWWQASRSMLTRMGIMTVGVSELPARYDVAFDYEHEHRWAEHEHD